MHGFFVLVEIEPSLLERVNCQNKNTL